MTEPVDLATFRQAIRAFVRDNLPPDIRQAVHQGQPLARERQVAWQEILAAQAYLVPHWPVNWGGQGWSVAQQMVFDEELCTHHAPELSAISYDMIGPVLMRWGTRDQQQRFLPAIASGRQAWCQGYSEPNAGSDLASLVTRAHRDGDDIIVNGSKIWTSGAQHADWIFCLVRTDPAARAQQGISFLLIDMQTPGITVRPIVGIHGWAVFNQVFFDDVRVPRHNLVGEENQGWTVAKSLLEFERLKLARIGENKRRRARLLDLLLQPDAGGSRLADQAWFRRRFAELEARLIALQANVQRFVERQQAGIPAGAEVSMLKLRGSRLIQLWEDLTMDALGPQALLLDPIALAGGPVGAGAGGIAATAASRRFLSRGYTIAGGSSEIQHNILAKQVLGL